MRTALESPPSPVRRPPASDECSSSHGQRTASLPSAERMAPPTGGREGGAEEGVGGRAYRSGRGGRPPRKRPRASSSHGGGGAIGVSLGRAPRVPPVATPVRMRARGRDDIATGPLHVDADSEPGASRDRMGHREIEVLPRSRRQDARSRWQLAVPALEFAQRLVPAGSWVDVEDDQTTGSHRRRSRCSGSACAPTASGSARDRSSRRRRRVHRGAPGTSRQGRAPEQLSSPSPRTATPATAGSSARSRRPRKRWTA